ncbi:MAG TPA: NUDIX domain-containing protein, partial [Hanamia sp.]|nr:NUDIX domain-containing protein [Hanamia sp.]
VLNAANRRLLEEMGFSTTLTPAFNFIYKATFDNGLTEHEFDHVFTGIHDGDIKADKTEVGDYCYKNLNDIDESLQTHPHKYTEWFKIALPQIKLFHANYFNKV